VLRATKDKNREINFTPSLVAQLDSSKKRAKVSQNKTKACRYILGRLLRRSLYPRPTPSLGWDNSILEDGAGAFFVGRLCHKELAVGAVLAGLEALASWLGLIHLFGV
jgi:hypothetical protein